MPAKREANTKTGYAAAATGDADADAAEASALTPDPPPSSASPLASPSLPSDFAANVSPEMAEGKYEVHVQRVHEIYWSRPLLLAA